MTSTDLTPELLQRSKARAVELGLTMDWREANAHALPFADREFDVVMSAIAVMFAPDQRCAADEMIRVCRSRGTIAVISWTPDGFFGRMLAAIRPYRPALTAAVPAAALWGREDYAVGLLGDRVTDISTRCELLLVDRLQTPEDVHYYFKNHYGPTIEAFANIGDNTVLATTLDNRLVELAHEYLMDGVTTRASRRPDRDTTTADKGIDQGRNARSCGTRSVIYCLTDFKLSLVLRWADMFPVATHLTNWRRAHIDFQRKVETTPQVALASRLAYGFVGAFAAIGCDVS